MQNENEYRELSDSIKHNDICIIGAPKTREKNEQIIYLNNGWKYL